MLYAYTQIYIGCVRWGGAALQMMAAEFPELAGGGAGGGQPFDAAVEAQQLQAACAAAGVRTWAAALALLLGDAAALEGIQ